MAIVMLYQNASLVNLPFFLSLLKILFSHLCLFLIINMCSKIHKGYRCVYWFFRLDLDRSMCRRKFGFISAIIIFICINPLYAS
jgi:hypothetical protein